MRHRAESFLHTGSCSGSPAPVRLAATLLGAAVLATASPALSASATRLVPKVTTESEGAGFRVKNQQLAIQPINLDVTRYAFTAPGRTVAARTQTVERSFTFTPSKSAKGVSVGVTTRAATPAPVVERTAAVDTSVGTGFAPGGYNFDLSVGYRGVSVSGGVSRVDTGVGSLGGGRTRDGVDLGLGYGQNNWTAALFASAERDSAYLVPRAGTPDPRYALEARGAVALSPAISVGGSVRYRMAPENPTPLDPNKDDKAVMLGGAVAF